MSDPALFGVFLLSALTIALAPGPDVVYVVARSLGQGRRAGLIAAGGISCGLMIHATAAVLGLSSLIAHAPALYEALRWAGVGYLLYLGARAFTGSDQLPWTDAADGPTRPPMRRVFLQAVLNNLLNPKVILFFLAFLPQFVSPDATGDAYVVEVLTLAAIFSGLGLGFQVILALVFGSAGDWLRTRPGFLRLQRYVMGSTLCAVAVWLALPDRA